jgi:hypothetical protein
MYHAPISNFLFVLFGRDASFPRFSLSLPHTCKIFLPYLRTKHTQASKREGMLSFLVLLSLATLQASSVTAAPLTCCNLGTLQNEIDTVTTGSTIELAAGTWTGCASFGNQTAPRGIDTRDKSLTIAGASAATTIVDCEVSCRCRSHIIPCFCFCCCMLVMCWFWFFFCFVVAWSPCVWVSLCKELCGRRVCVQGLRVRFT